MYIGIIETTEKPVTDLSHLNALQSRLNREIKRLANAINENEKSFRGLQVSQCRKEIESEYQFLGIKPLSLEEILMSADELLDALGV